MQYNNIMIMTKPRKGKSRSLDPEFITALKAGILTPFWERVKNDKTLCLEIRENYINIYYRGCSISKIAQNKDTKSYTYSFDEEYFKKETIKLPNENILEIDSAKAWINYFPTLKNIIDMSSKGGEREFQQLVVRENNDRNTGNSTDYYICDVEYTSARKNGRFDLIALKWLSKGAERKINKELKLAFIEKKYGDGAIGGEAGILKHIRDFTKFITKDADYLHEEMKEIFNLKLNLGLIKGCKKKIESIQSIKKYKPEVILLLANHDPEKTGLKKILLELIDSDDYKEFCKIAELKFAVASFMGYGLYEQGIYDLPTFLNRFEKFLR